MKAITITAETQKMLTSRYFIESYDVEVQLPIGHILIADFGNSDTFEVITKEAFDQLFDRDIDLKNGFYAIRRK